MKKRAVRLLLPREEKQHLAMERAGLLENTDMLCINAVELKGKYVGHTAPKVKEAFEDYGILLLDEAYSLAEGEQGGDGFSGEVLSQLCVELEKHGQDRLVIFAGYGGDRRDDPMGRFFDANPGIRSRVGFHIHFEDFRPDELALAELPHRDRDYCV